MNQSLNNSRRLIRLPEVKSKSGYGRSTIYAEIKAGRFPRPLKIGKRASAWSEAEIDEWIAARIAARDASAIAP